MASAASGAHAERSADFCWWGAYSQKHYLDGVHAPKAQKNLTETVRAWESYLPKFLPLVHPSPLNFRWQAKNPWFEQEVVPALQKRVGEVLEGV